MPVYTAAGFRYAVLVCAPALCRHSKVAHLLNPSVGDLMGTGVSVSVPATSAPPYYGTRIPVYLPRQHPRGACRTICKSRVWHGVLAAFSSGMACLFVHLLYPSATTRWCRHGNMYTCRVPLLSCRSLDMPSLACYVLASCCGSRGMTLCAPTASQHCTYIHLFAYP